MTDKPKAGELWKSRKGGIYAFITKAPPSYEYSHAATITFDLFNHPVLGRLEQEINSIGEFLKYFERVNNER